MTGPALTIRRLSATDVTRMRDLLAFFAAAFDEPEMYGAAPPSAAYLERILAKPHFFVLVAEEQGEIIGGLAAYELEKFEQERSEIFIYDLAVAEAHRRRGVATALIEEMRRIAAGRGAYVMFIATEADNHPAVALYSKLGIREDAYHFDIAVHRNK